MSWFDEVAHGGTSEWERQSWRDNFNSGRAAGDLTGGTNARLDAERAAFQGATWGGSSTHMSALDLARARGGSGVPAAMVSDAMAGRLGSEPPGAAMARGATRGKALIAGFGPGGVFAPDATDMVMSGRHVKANPYWIDAETVEQRWSDVGSALYTPFVMGADFGHNAARMYFGENYAKIPTAERLRILGAHATELSSAGVRGGQQNVLGAFFGGVNAIQQWGRDNRAVEEAAGKAAAEFDALWDYKEHLQRQENDKRFEIVNPPQVHWTEDRLPSGVWGY